MSQLVGVTAQLIEVLGVEDVSTSANASSFASAPPPPPTAAVRNSGRRSLSAMHGVAVRFAVRMSTPKAAAAVTSALTTALAPRSAAAAQSYAQFAAAGLVSSVVIGGITLSDTFTAAPPPPAPPPVPPAPSAFTPKLQAAVGIVGVVPLLCGLVIYLRRRRVRRLEALKAEAQAKLEWVYEDKATAAAHYAERNAKPSRRASMAGLPAARPSMQLPGASGARDEAQQQGGWNVAGWFGAAAEAAQAAQPQVAARVPTGRYAPEGAASGRDPSRHRSVRLGPDGQPLPRRKRKHKKYLMKGFKDLDPNLL